MKTKLLMIAGAAVGYVLLLSAMLYVGTRIVRCDWMAS